jgi:hypothetical protein
LFTRSQSAGPAITALRRPVADADLHVELVALGIGEQRPSGKERASAFADTI